MVKSVSPIYITPHSAAIDRPSATSTSTLAVDSSSTVAARMGVAGDGVSAAARREFWHPLEFPSSAPAQSDATPAGAGPSAADGVGPSVTDGSSAAAAGTLASTVGAWMFRSL